MVGAVQGEKREEVCVSRVTVNRRESYLTEPITEKHTGTNKLLVLQPGGETGACMDVCQCTYAQIELK